MTREGDREEEQVMVCVKGVQAQYGNGPECGTALCTNTGARCGNMECGIILRGTDIQTDRQITLETDISGDKFGIDNPSKIVNFDQKNPPKTPPLECFVNKNYHKLKIRQDRVKSVIII